MHDAELTVLKNLTNVYRLERVLVAGMHLFLTTRGIEFEAINGFAYLIHIQRTCFFRCCSPYFDTKVGSFNRIVRYAVITKLGLKGLNKRVVLRRINALVVIPGSQVTDEWGNIHGSQFVFGNGECHDRAISR